MITIDKLNFRTEILKQCNAGTQEIEELLKYNNRYFDHSYNEEISLPLEDERHIEVWEDYIEEAKEKGTFATLKEKLVQFNFLIKEGISEQSFYKDVTLRGKDIDEVPEATELELERPEKLELTVEQTIAGKIPVLKVKHRPDFVSIIQAILKKNEPQEIPDSMGATMISGYNNWDRIRRYKEEWLNDNLAWNWRKEFKRLISKKELYQDKFMVLSDNNYSAISAKELNLSEAEWREYSLKIRLGHESTHYFTKRALGSMETHLLDELIADYMGLSNALGYYKAKWFLKFMGVEGSTKYREGGRLENYVDRNLLSRSSFEILQRLVRKAAMNLEKFDKLYLNEENDYKKLMTLTYFTLEELAVDKAIELLNDRFTKVTKINIMEINN